MGKIMHDLLIAKASSYVPLTARLTALILYCFYYQLNELQLFKHSTCLAAYPSY